MQSRQFRGDAVRRYLCRFYEIRREMIRGMTCAALTDSISHNFIAQMIPHHRAAIAMAENLLPYTEFEPLRRIAEGIIEEQTKSIADMEAVLAGCGELSNTRQELCRYQREVCGIMRTMFFRMGHACSDGNINGDFMREMIPHHQGAIQMSKNALKYPICPELTLILRAIITSQEKGVGEMEALLRRGKGPGSTPCGTEG